MRWPLALVVLLLIAPGSAAGAVRYRVERPLASVRSAPGSFAIGHVFGGVRVDVVARRRGWAYANWGGRCGWLLRRGLRPTGVSTAATCPSPRTLTPRRLFARASYQLGCGQGCVYPARVVPCEDRTVYANYARGVFTDPVGREPLGRGTRGVRVPRYRDVHRGYPGFGLRYVTRDGAATLIKDSRRGGPVWRFIRSACIERLSLLVSGRAVGAFRPGDGVARAVRAFGRVFVRSGCEIRWPRVALTVRFRGCRRGVVVLVGRQPIRGAALVHTWATEAGLRLGDRLARLRHLYPLARRSRTGYRLGPGLRAVIAGGRVAAFRVS